MGLVTAQAHQPALLVIPQLLMLKTRPHRPGLLQHAGDRHMLHLSSLARPPQPHRPGLQPLHRPRSARPLHLLRITPPQMNVLTVPPSALPVPTFSRLHRLVPLPPHRQCHPPTPRNLQPPLLLRQSPVVVGAVRARTPRRPRSPDVPPQLRQRRARAAARRPAAQAAGREAGRSQRGRRTRDCVTRELAPRRVHPHTARVARASSSGAACQHRSTDASAASSHR